jgi:hypothetical protein
LVNLLIERSGYRIALTDGRANKEVRTLILSVVKREMTFDELVAWFEEHLVKTEI